MKDKIILLINNGYPSPNFPNYTTYIKSINDCINEAGFKSEIVAIQYNKRISLISKAFNYLKFWFKLLVKRLNKYDFIYINHPTFCFPLFFNPTLNKNKIIFHWHGNDLTTSNKLLKIINNLIRKTTIDSIINIVPSEYFRNKLIKVMDYKKENIFISPSGGIDVNIFKSSLINSNKIRIGFAASIQSCKGIDIFLSLIKNKKFIENEIKQQLEFHLINYGKEAEEYIHLIKKYDSAIVIHPKMSKIEMPTFYNQIDILIFPSKREGESLGLVALEAMSCGKPVIAFNHCAFPEFIKHNQTGELCVNSNNLKKDSTEFIEKIIYVINNYDKYNPREEIIKNYSKEKVISQYNELFSK